jgi:hypothetical protein
MKDYRKPMNSQHKKFLKAIQKLELTDEWSHSDLARNTAEAYRLLDEIITIEQTKRLNRLWIRRPTPASVFSIGSLSNLTLNAYKGWAARVLDTAEGLKQKPDDRVKARSLETMTVARDYLLQNKNRFLETPKDSIFHRGAYAFQKKVTSMVGKPNFKNWFRKSQKPATSDFMDFKSIRDHIAYEDAAVGKRAEEIRIQLDEWDARRKAREAAATCKKCFDTGTIPEVTDQDHTPLEPAKPCDCGCKVVEAERFTITNLPPLCSYCNDTKISPPLSISPSLFTATQGPCERCQGAVAAIPQS